MSISDYPERISILPTCRQKREDDFFLVDRKAFPGKGTEYVRADRIEELEAKLAMAVGALQCWDTMLDNPQYDLGEMAEEFTTIVRTTLKELTGDTNG